MTGRMATFWGTMKSLLCLVTSVLQDAGMRCGTDVQRDIKEIARRSREEGEHFLLTVLPSFGRAFEQALAVGGCASAPFPGFRKRRGYPLFLGGMLRLIFCDNGKAVVDDPDSTVVQAIRQVCGVVGKLFEVCPEKYVGASLDDYVNCELDMDELYLGPVHLDRLGFTFARYFGKYVSSIEENLRLGAVVPGHGPGATADGYLGNEKYDLVDWDTGLDRVFPVGDFVTPFRAPVDHVTIHEPGMEPLPKVTAVPKTATKARIITVEPAYRQFAQQAILKEFSRVFRGTPFVDLSDQQTNRRLACIGSDDGSLATLDLSEASDRVHVDVVRAVFRRFPFIMGALEATRSKSSRLPDGTIVSLSKFASMGSAVCFPVESLVFATVALDAIERAVDSCSWAYLSKDDLARTVRVFGDDIIVPTRYVHDVIRALSAIGARVNASKSFWTGKFRESCGGDYFSGDDVTIARLRRRLPRSRQDASELLSLIAFRNHLYVRGYWGTAKRIDDWMRLLRIPMPIVEETSPVVGRRSVFQYAVERFHEDYQSPLVKGLRVSSASPKSCCSEAGALLKCTLPGRNEPFADVEHLTRSGRPRSVHLRLGWGSPF